MNQHEFIHLMQKRRGLSNSPSNVRYLREIYDNSIPQLVELTLTKKLFGIKNMAHIAKANSHAKQEEFCKWLATKNWKATKDEMMLWS